MTGAVHSGPVTACKRIAMGTLARLPQGALSRAVGRLADLPIPRPLRRPVLGAVARMLGIDMGEAELPIAAYGTVDELFTRRLQPGCRPIAEERSAMVSPVDGILGATGVVRDDRLLQVKGRGYSLAALLDDAAVAARYEGGSFVTLYLAPRHYHRIHSPCDGAVRTARHVPGKLMPVNPPSLLLTPDLFPRNERLVCHIDGSGGRTAVVAVGAFNVGRISAAFDPSWNRPTGGVTNRRGATAETRTYDPPVPVQKGEEIMAFHLGSTVVLVVEPGRGELAPSLANGDEVRFGQAIVNLG